MSSPLHRLADALSPTGLNELGVVDAAAWDRQARPAQQVGALLDGGAQIVVVGSGGPALWRAFVDHLRRQPGWLSDHRHPLEAFVERAVMAADPALGDLPRRWIYAAAEETTFIDFRALAALAGLGVRSRLGLLMHPVHGPWMGLRAACVVGGVVGVAGRPLDHSACDGCAAPCVPACPGAAFPDGAFSIGRCAAFHQDSILCATTCHSRAACPEGVASRYPPEEIRYHYDRVGGRSVLRRALGIPEAADPHGGDPLRWAAWSD
jgi:hypothetical protein